MAGTGMDSRVQGGEGHRSSGHSALPPGSQARVQVGGNEDCMAVPPWPPLWTQGLCNGASFLLHSFTVPVVEIATGWL